MAHALRSLIFALALGALLTARAQNPGASEQHLRFTVFSPRPATGLAFTPRAGAAAQAVVAYPTARSPHYDYRGAMPLRLIDSKSGAVVAEATVPAALTEVLLLLLPVEPAPASGLRYRVAVLDDSAARQAPGTLAVVNLSGLALAGTLDGKPLSLTEGLNPPVAVGRGAALTLRTPAKGRTFQAYAGEIALGKGERALLLLWPPFYQGSLEVQSRLLTDAPPVLARP